MSRAYYIQIELDEVPQDLVYDAESAIEDFIRLLPDADGLCWQRHAMGPKKDLTLSRAKALVSIGGRQTEDQFALQMAERVWKETGRFVKVNLYEVCIDEMTSHTTNEEQFRRYQELHPPETEEDLE